MMPAINRTKVVATVGPACRDVATLSAMIAEGVDVFRLNFSHGSLDEHADAVANIRTATHEQDAIVAILGDLSGPKIRLGDVEGDSFEIREGDSIRIERGSFPCTRKRVCTNYDKLLDDLKPNQRILIDDGQLEWQVEHLAEDAATCRCVIGGEVNSRKGVNLPDTNLSLPSMTDKDHRDLAWAIEQNLDYVALSFVRSAEDIAALRAAIAEKNGELGIVAKIERPEAIDDIDAIIEQSDVIMVARGDLGVEMNVARVPLIQKDITHRCAAAARPVIIATQMLQSMVESSTPTRAEVNDVANAILDGADAVMLSAETSVGKHPIAALRVIRDIATRTEDFLAEDDEANEPTRVHSRAIPFVAAIANGAAVLADELDATVLAVSTDSGATVRLLSKTRPTQIILGLSASAAVCRKMALFYGVQPVQLDRPRTENDLLDAVDAAIHRLGIASPGDIAVVLRGTQLQQAGGTNTLHINLIGVPLDWDSA